MLACLQFHHVYDKSLARVALSEVITCWGIRKVIKRERGLGENHNDRGGGLIQCLTGLNMVSYQIFWRLISLSRQHCS